MSKGRTAHASTSRLKRAFDVFVATTMLLLLSPLFAFVALSVFLSLGRPICFRQVRIGLDEARFVILKFRTMKEMTLPDGQVAPDEERITKIGKILRRTSLDELPELLNVVAGNMSLVGPRPLLPRYLPFYRESERIRHEVLPGITGWAQICGRNQVSWDERLALDAWYVENWSFGLDLKILTKTLTVVVFGNGHVAVPGSIMQDLDSERRHG